MYEIQLKFYNSYWSNYFKKKYTQEKAVELFCNLILCYPDSQWRLVYKENEKKINGKEVKA